MTRRESACSVSVHSNKGRRTGSCGKPSGPISTRKSESSANGRRISNAGSDIRLQGVTCRMRPFRPGLRPGERTRRVNVLGQPIDLARGGRLGYRSAAAISGAEQCSCRGLCGPLHLGWRQDAFTAHGIRHSHGGWPPGVVLALWQQRPCPALSSGWGTVVILRVWHGREER
jgi:hypothetical protein